MALDYRSDSDHHGFFLMKNALIPVLFTWVIFQPVSPAVAGSVETGASGAIESTAEKQCNALGAADFSGIQDAATQIMEAKLVQAGGSIPAYCQVQGYIAPQVGFELRLPVSNWNGKFMEVGCGGWCGSINASACDIPLRHGYACVASDMGHKGSGMDLLWAANNIQAQIDFGYRATHVAAVAGKTIAKSYYNTSPHRSYFVGCSAGGYQGVTEAQRYPWDFDGILAGAPDIDLGAASLRALWIATVFLDENGKARLNHNQLQLVHQAALARCDMDDGVKDGVIGNPLACKFDPRELICKANQTKGCLTPTQAEIVHKLYAGPMTSKGERTSTGGYLPGSELLWEEIWPADSVAQSFKYGMAGYTTGTQWKYTDFDFDRDYQRLGVTPWYDNSNPDLRKFKRAGGKLIIYHGGTDTIDLPGAVTDYYDAVERTMGGRKATQDFFRLFMVPGMNHCSGGQGAFSVDWFSYLEAWVEQGKAPDRVMSTRVNQDYLASLPLPDDLGIPAGTTLTFEDRAMIAASRLTFPLDPKILVSFTRPIYPYPLYAKYKGVGDPNDASNFVATE